MILHFLKWLISRFHAIPNYCHRCGRRTEAFVVPDALWKIITNDSEPLCFRCFDRLARKKYFYSPPVWFVE